jgi:hypothetical protein
VGSKRMEPPGACDIDGQTDRSNGAYGKSDIEGKTAREAASELGKGASFKWAGAHESISIEPHRRLRPLERGQNN